ncbi:MAG TPA: sigma factor-like helix-turn-helix DNA-binding protein [Methylomirabilota bacterium]|nr:sigma factor-like helix-turn-helix DNA-binding protein [Methylomirabilota bacterium]
MPTYAQVSLQRGRGLTFAEIGELFGISRQRAHSIFTGYMRMYKQTEKYRAYERHYSGHVRPVGDCKYCL